MSVTTNTATVKLVCFNIIRFSVKWYTTLDWKC